MSENQPIQPNESVVETVLNADGRSEKRSPLSQTRKGDRLLSRISGYSMMRLENAQKIVNKK